MEIQRCVVDASVGVKCLRSGEPLTEEARSLLDPCLPGFAARRTVPDLFDLECASALAKARRRGDLTAEELVRGLEILGELPVGRIPARPLAGHAGRLAADRCVTIYDAVYVMLAALLDAPLITADERLVHAMEGGPVEVVSLAGLGV